MAGPKKPEEMTWQDDVFNRNYEGIKRRAKETIDENLAPGGLANDAATAGADYFLPDSDLDLALTVGSAFPPVAIAKGARRIGKFLKMAGDTTPPATARNVKVDAQHLPTLANPTQVNPRVDPNAPVREGRRQPLDARIDAERVLNDRINASIDPPVLTEFQKIQKANKWKNR